MNIFSADERNFHARNPSTIYRTDTQLCKGRRSTQGAHFHTKAIELAFNGNLENKTQKTAEPDKWSIAEILGHIADTEIACSFRIRFILGSNGAPIQAFDQDVWAQYSNYPNQDPALSLEAYRINRERNIHLLKSLAPDKWNYYGIHSERGKETVTRVTEMLAGHDINHLNQIRQLIKGKTK